MAIKIKEGKPTNIIRVKKMRDYSKDPIFIKKAEEASKFIDEHPLPDSFMKKS